jgi:hypothetical protein
VFDPGYQAQAEPAPDGGLLAECVNAINTYFGGSAA